VLLPLPTLIGVHTLPRSHFILRRRHSTPGTEGESVLCMHSPGVGLLTGHCRNEPWVIGSNPLHQRPPLHHLYVQIRQCPPLRNISDYCAWQVCIIGNTSFLLSSRSFEKPRGWLVSKPLLFFHFGGHVSLYRPKEGAHSEESST
jgi:hypothetical protein